MAKTPAWTRKEGKDPKGGLNAKGRASYNKAQGQILSPLSSAKQPKKAGKSQEHSVRVCQG
jgi:hypothetical protein